MLAGVLLGTIECHPGLRHWTDERLEVGVSSEEIRAGIDGEPITLKAPLRFSAVPSAACARAARFRHQPVRASATGWVACRPQAAPLAASVLDGSKPAA
jgi:hypothetical protein